MAPNPFQFNLSGDSNPIGREVPQPLSVHAEHQLNSPTDIGKAHQFFQPAQAGHAAVGHAAMAPGADLQGLTAKAIAQLQSQVSPMIQLIMRMPGHIGLMSSAFEAFANFFMPHAELIGGLDHSLLTAHVDAASSIGHAGGAEHLSMGGSEHMAVDTHLLPHDAPILHELHLEGGELASSTSEHGFNLSYVNEDLLFDKGSLNVAGTLDAAKPQFEGMSFTDSHGEILSGPSLSSASPATHLATSSHHAVFEKALSHGAGAGNPMNSALATNSTAPVSSGMSQSLPLNASNGSMNVGSNSFGQPAGGSNLVNAPTDSSSMNQMNGADGGSFGQPAADHLSGNNQLLAMNKTGGADMHSASDASTTSEYNYGNYNHAQGADHLGSAAKGLHAKSLSLDSLKNGHAAGDTQTAAHATTDSSSANSSATHGADKHVASADKHVAPKQHAADAVKDKVASAKPAAVSATKAATSAVTSTVAKAATPVVDAHAAAPADTQTIASADTASAAEAIPENPADTAAAGNPAATTEAVSTPSVSYTIKAGDNLWNIAKDNLHSAAKWEDIYKLNHDVLGANPSLIRPGTTIQMPGSEQAVATTGEATKYVVKSGDNLWNLAKNNLGDGNKWGELYKLNHDLIGSNPSLIQPGQELTLSAPAPGGEVGTLADASGVAPTDISGVAPTAAAPEQIASAPMSSSAPAEFGQPESISQFGSPAESQIPLAPTQQAVEQATAAPMDSVMPPQSSLPQTSGAANAAALQPGAAGAATLSQPTPNVVPGPDSPDKASVVSSNMLGNLQDFLSRKK